MFPCAAHGGLQRVYPLSHITTFQVKNGKNRLGVSLILCHPFPVAEDVRSHFLIRPLRTDSGHSPPQYLQVVMAGRSIAPLRPWPVD